MRKFLNKTTGLFTLALLIVVVGCGKNPTSILESDENGMKSEVYNMIAEGPSCIDADGNVYKVVKIGDQWWMAENLRTTHFKNGEQIPEVRDRNEWRNLRTAAFCYYENDITIETEYGLLYNWKATTDRRNIAPEGWHVPTDTEFQTLENYLGGRGKAGGKLKEQGNEHWAYPNNASNSSGFTALPGGYRDSRGDFYGKPGFGFFWTSTKSHISGAWNRYLDHMFVELERSNFHNRSGFSVRCVLNTERNVVLRID